MLMTITENASLSICGVSAPTYCRAKNVRVVSVVVPELEFRDVQRQIFAADFVEAPHDAALQQRPEAVNRGGMDDAINILPLE
jgi:hypothetical protein